MTRNLTLVFLLISALSAAAPNKRFSTIQYALLPSLLAGNLALNATDAPKDAHWKGGILLDDSVRDLFRAGTRGKRETIATIGDVMLGVVAFYPLAIDAVGNAWIVNGDGDTAGQLSLIAAQGLLLTSFLRVLAKVTVGRERPFQQECGRDPGYEADCGLPSSRSSFFSGHAAISFTGAGLICSAHEQFHLAGGNAPCYAAIGLATMISISRMVADKHYFSDTLVGMLVGWTSGYFIPKWINYADSSQVTLSPTVSHNGWNVALSVPW